MKREKLAQPDHYSNLSAILDTASSVLSRGVADRRAPAHTPAIATVTRDGIPRLRTVVLRGYSQSGRWIQFHTDRRAAKVDEMTGNSHAAAMIYDPGRKIQIRLGGKAQILEKGDTYEAAWEKTRPQSRVCYQVTQAPGSILSDPEDALFSAEETSDGGDNFLVVRLQFDEIEWLYLAASGHRRARFRWQSETWDGEWLVP